MSGAPFQIYQDPSVDQTQNPRRPPLRGGLVDRGPQIQPVNQAFPRRASPENYPRVHRHNFQVIEEEIMEPPNTSGDESVRLLRALGGLPLIYAARNPLTPAREQSPLPPPFEVYEDPYAYPEEHGIIPGLGLVDRVAPLALGPPPRPTLFQLLRATGGQNRRRTGIRPRPAPNFPAANAGDMERRRFNVLGGARGTPVRAPRGGQQAVGQTTPRRIPVVRTPERAGPPISPITMNDLLYMREELRGTKDKDRELLGFHRPYEQYPQQASPVPARENPSRSKIRIEMDIVEEQTASPAIQSSTPERQMGEIDWDEMQLSPLNEEELNYIRQGVAGQEGLTPQEPGALQMNPYTPEGAEQLRQRSNAALGRSGDEGFPGAATTPLGSGRRIVSHSRRTSSGGRQIFEEHSCEVSSENYPTPEVMRGGRDDVDPFYMPMYREDECLGVPPENQEPSEPSWTVEPLQHVSLNVSYTSIQEEPRAGPSPPPPSIPSTPGSPYSPVREPLQEDPCRNTCPLTMDNITKTEKFQRILDDWYATVGAQLGLTPAPVSPTSGAEWDRVEENMERQRAEKTMEMQRREAEERARVEEQQRREAEEREREAREMEERQRIETEERERLEDLNEADEFQELMNDWLRAWSKAVTMRPMGIVPPFPKTKRQLRMERREAEERARAQRELEEQQIMEAEERARDPILSGSMQYAAPYSTQGYALGSPLASPSSPPDISPVRYGENADPENDLYAYHDYVEGSPHTSSENDYSYDQASCLAYTLNYMDHLLEHMKSGRKTSLPPYKDTRIRTRRRKKGEKRKNDILELYNQITSNPLPEPVKEKRLDDLPEVDELEKCLNEYLAAQSSWRTWRAEVPARKVPAEPDFNLQKRIIPTGEIPETTEDATHKFDMLNTEFMFYASLLKKHSPSLKDRKARTSIAKWVKKLFGPQYHVTTELQDKRNRYLMALTLSVMSNNILSIFLIPPPMGDLGDPDFFREVSNKPARWEQDDLWQDVICGLPDPGVLELPCGLHISGLICPESSRAKAGLDGKRGAENKGNDLKESALLDREYRFLLYLGKELASKLEDPFYKTTAATWLHALSAVTHDSTSKAYVEKTRAQRIETWPCPLKRGVRNDFMQALLACLLESKLDSLFNAAPPQNGDGGPLVTLKIWADSRGHRLKSDLASPTSSFADKFLIKQPVPKDGAFAFVALSGDSLNLWFPDCKEQGDGPNNSDKVETRTTRSQITIMHEETFDPEG